MKKLSIPLSLLAAATLAACGTTAVQTDSTVYVTPVSGASVRAGPGKVSELLDPTGPVNGLSWQRMMLKMDDGTSQILDRRGPQVALGENLRVRADGTFKRDSDEIRARP